MPARRERRLQVRDLDLHLLEEGEGPLVLLCHGFPETARCWDRQLRDLAEAGLRAVAPDLRGYGATRGSASHAECDVVSLTEDLVALVHALGEEDCVLVGHDFGALLSWHAASLRPDVFRAVACLSVGFPSILAGPRAPLEVLRRKYSGSFFYIVHFQEPGVAEAELDADPRASLARIVWANSAEAPADLEAAFLPGVAPRATLFGGVEVPDGLPSWLDPAAFEEDAADFARTGFAGALAWYRAMDRSWERLGRGVDPRAARVEVPALYVVGDRDIVHRTTGSLVARMREAVPRLEEPLVLAGCGHWTQRERPCEVSAALVDFARRHSEGRAA